MSSTPMVNQTDNISKSIHNLYVDHNVWLKNWLRSRLSCSEKAGDIAQDTFMRIIISQRLATKIVNEPRALLTHIARNLVIDHWRRQDVERAYIDALSHIPTHEVPSEETKLIIIEALTRIDTMLATMPTLTRDIFLLAQFDGLTLKQISERTNVAVITVRRHIHKALIACMDIV